LLFASPITPLVPVSYNKQQALLGKMLFFDPVLSADNKISCASCHSPSFSGADNKRFSIGVFGRIDKPMNSPSVYNAVFNCRQFWNGRANDLKQQAIMAAHDFNEMGMSDDVLEKKINSIEKYKALFKKVYGVNYIKADLIYQSIAEFEKALVTLDCRFDRYLKGDKKALNEDEKKGYYLFKVYGCITCHNGKNLGSNSFQKLGIFIKDINITEGNDRYKVTHKKSDRYVYKVPTLRNIALTAPYFHDGSVKTLKKAIELMGKYNLGIEIPKEDVLYIEKFLKTLTGKTPLILRGEYEEEK